MTDDRKVRIPRILLLGCGRMGGSLLSRWLSKDLISVSDMLVVEPDSSALKNIEKSRRPRQVKSIADIEALKEPVCVVLAVKPQQFEEVIAFLAGLPYGSVLLSVAAGIRISRFRQAVSSVRRDCTGDAKPPRRNRCRRHGAIRRRTYNKVTEIGLR